MLPVGPMMVEHRLIERMIALLQREAKEIRGRGHVNTDFILSAVDFIRTYADRCHHGKEEGILFRKLAKKPLSAEHRRILSELETEHVRGREITLALVDARSRFLRGDRAAAKELALRMEDLAAFYPRHIDKEDQRFFLPCMDYFTQEEQDRMLEECQEFDRNLVHGIYADAVSGLERERGIQATRETSLSMDAPPAERFACMACGYTYDPRMGDSVGHVPPGMPFQDLSPEWICPRCHASKRMFVRVKG